VLYGIAEICGIFAPDPVEEDNEPNIEDLICGIYSEDVLSSIVLCQKIELFNESYYRLLLEKEYRGL
jgi:hypothetical protein